MPVTFVEQDANTVNKRPSVGQWIKHTWLDIYMLVFLGGIAFALSGEPKNRYDNDISPWYLRWWATVLFFTLVPAIVILLSQIFVRSFWDTNNAILGLLFSITSAWCCAKVLQKLLGTLSQDEDIESFPGISSTLAFAGLIFLFLYLNAKLKLWANYRPSLWKLTLLFIPLLLATVAAILEKLRRDIHSYHCIAGALIGTLFALAGYRMVYASVFDFRFNHIPLSPMEPNISEAKRQFQYEYQDATIARSRKWGSYEKPHGRVQSVWTTPYAPQQCAQCGHGQTLPLGQDGIAESPAMVAGQGTLADDGSDVEIRGSDASTRSLSVIHERITEGSEGVVGVIREHATEGEENV